MNRPVIYILILFILISHSSAQPGVPQPPFTFYGTAFVDNTALDASDHEYTITIMVNDTVVTVYQMGQSETDNYILQVPIDTGPGLTTAVQTGDTAFIYINNISVSENPVTIGQSGVNEVLDIHAQIPPSKVTNLTASTGQTFGEIILNWTAPGDDKRIGTAASYSMKHSFSPVDSVEWTNAADLDNEPAPAVSGTKESMIAKNLPDGQVLWFAMIATDDAGNASHISNTDSAYTKYLPVADAGGPYTAYEADIVEFDANGSFDPDGDIVLYEWDWDFDNNMDYSSNFSTASHTWNDDFSGRILIKVTDNDGGTDIDTAFVTINNVSPQLNVVKDINSHAGNLIILDDLSFYDPAGDQDTYVLKVDWGDNEIDSNLVRYDQNLQNLFKHIYTDSGHYEIIVTLSDEDNGIDTDTIYANIIQYDLYPPVITNCCPPNHSRFIPVNSDILFDLVDINEIDSTSIVISVNNDTLITNGMDRTDGLCDIKKIEYGYRIYYIPETEFDSMATVIIDITCRDRFENPNVLQGILKFETGNMRMEIQAESEIHPEGGSISTREGAVIFIPEGAFDYSQRIYIATVDKSPALHDSLKGLGSVYFLGPHGFKFNRFADFSILFNEEQMIQAGAIIPGSMNVVSFSDSGLQWQIIPWPEIDDVNQKLTVKLNHFSFYQLVNSSPSIREPNSKKTISVFNYPNPLNPDKSGTIIKLISSKDMIIDCNIFDLSGMIVRSLVENMPILKSIPYNIEWDGKNGFGKTVSNDVYYCVIKSDDGKQVIRKIAVLR
jgi:hypothetical protein